MDELRETSHRRYNPLTGQWVLNSAHRLDRPWQGEQSEPHSSRRPQYDPQCYLCPGNARVSGNRNPDYAQTFVFDNDFPALLARAGNRLIAADGLFVARAESGVCRVLCFSPRHDLDIATMQQEPVRAVVDEWARQYEELISAEGIRCVTIFENRGAMMGASNPHPHSQVWAQTSVPDEFLKEEVGLQTYEHEQHACLLCAYARREVELGDRIVYADALVCAVVPFWAVWPFEILLLPLHHAAHLGSCGPSARDAVANAMRAVTSQYDRLFGTAFPYSMGWHQAPAEAHGDLWHVHAHYYPPLLRSATVRKYVVGYEMLAGPQRDITPESAAKRLREA